MQLRVAGRFIRRVVLAGLLLAVASAARAGTTGTIAGVVLDDKGSPVAVATVRVEDQRFGAYTNDAGEFTILNVPPGTYSLRVSRIGYESVVIRDLVVSADETTRTEVRANPTLIESAEVVVVAERLPVDLKITSGRVSVTEKEIEMLPIQDLQDVVDLQAGVVDGHFRGGRLGEVQYQVDGVSVNDPFNNTAIVSVDRSLLQEAQVISGTFDAEYGQAMSGVVNAVLKSGTEEFDGNVEVYGGDFAYGESADRIVTHSFDPLGTQSYQASLSGPLGLPHTVFLASARYFRFDDYVDAERRFVPTDRADFESREFFPTGDGSREALGWTREWSGVLKLTNRSLHNSEISYQALLNRTTSRRTDWAFRFDPDGLSKQWSFSAAHGLDWTRTLSAKTFLEASLRQNYTEYHDWAYDDLFDERYDEAGPPQGDFGYELGAFVQGVSFTRYRRKTNSTVFKTSLVTQPNATHQVKLGGEVNVSRVEFGSPGTLTYATVDGVERLVRHVNEPPDFPGVTQYRPVFGGVFAQDFLSFDDLTLRVGLRGDYFDSRAYLPGDLENPANSITGSPTAAPRKSSRKVSVSPRLGVAYPIEDFAAVHFAYGHFRQFPAIGDIFSNADYSVLANLQAGGTDFGVLGNPDVRPEFTVQYEIGYKQAIDENLGIDVTAFYKDIRDLLGVEFITTYNGAQYARLTNVDFGSVVGFTLTVDHRSLGPLDTHLDYTWQRASGNASDPRETATRAEAGEDPRPRLIPLNWDQRHTLNLTGSWNDAGPYNVSTVIRAVSGQPYTPVITAGFGGGLDTNSGRKPVGVDVDLRAERRVEVAGEGMNVFFRVFNVFDGRFFNGAVYPSTGSPYYSRFPEADAVSLGTPTRFEAPRRIEFGLRWQPEGSR